MAIPIHTLFAQLRQKLGAGAGSGDLRHAMVVSFRMLKLLPERVCFIQHLSVKKQNIQPQCFRYLI